MSKVNFVQLKHLLVRNKNQIEIKPNNIYKQVTVKLWNNGIVKRNEVPGSEIKSKKRYVVSKGQFIISKIDARHGAYGFIPSELDGAVTTGDFLTYNIKEELIDPSYLAWLVRTEAFRQACLSASSGTTNRIRLNEQLFLDISIPLPDKQIQKKIVNKLNFVYEKYERIKALIETNFKLVKLCRKWILQQAVQGKLVPQDSNDEPASVLLEKIREEKKRLVKEKKIRKEKELPPIKEEKLPHQIPNSWVWVRLDTISSYIQRGKSPKYSEIKQIPVISQKCIQWNGFDLSKARFIDPNTLDSYNEERFLQDGDLLWNSTGHGTLGRINVFYKDDRYQMYVADSHVTVIRLFKNLVLPKFVYYWLSGPVVQSEIYDKSSGSTKQLELSTQVVKEYLVPLPPLNEQKRIVVKVDQLMSFCDQLEEQLERCNLSVDQLLKSVLNEVI